MSARLAGSSPRLRGTEWDGQAIRCSERFIPAPAGNRILTSSSSLTTPVHPRACGEQNRCPPPSCRRFGSSPRLRGTGICAGREVVPLRFIPAPAGNSLGGWSHSRSPTVHPRACGEQRCVLAHGLLSPGSSPRLRGTAVHHGHAEVLCRFIPAPAGNRGHLLDIRVELSVHPRACGEQRPFTTFRQTRNGSSPRLRGTEPATRLLF